MTLGILLAGLAVGGAYGYIAQRGAFCMNSGFRFVVTRRDFTKVKAYALAVAVGMLALPAVFALGGAQPTSPAFYPAGAILGGLLFGASMGWAGGCAAGVWYKLGAGSLSALVGVAGMALGAAALEIGPLAGARAAIQSLGPAISPAGIDRLWQLAPLVGIALLVALWRAAPGSAGAWSWQRTGLLMGIVATLAWPLSSIGGREFGMAIVPGTLALVTDTARPASLLGSWDVWFVLGIPAGAWIAARRSGPVRPSAPSLSSVPKLFVGGLGLGAGASLAAGCTVGHGLAGLPLLAPGSVVTMAAIFLGSTAAVLARQRLERPTPPLARVRP